MSFKIFVCRLFIICVSICFQGGKAETLSNDTGLNVYQFISKYNYTYENHTITTEDEYILQTFRLPYSRYETSTNTTRPVALMLHGIWSNPNDFLIQGPEKSLGFILADAGYDVWIMASRGNTYSINHTTLDTNSLAFWNFSFHEVGYYDIPANIEYITNLTGQTNVTYFGHSQGGTAYVVMSASRPEYNSRITLAVLLAPVVYLTNTKTTAITVLGELYDLVKVVGELLELKDILYYSEFYLNVAKIFCSPNSSSVELCKDIIGLFAGPDSSQINNSLLTVIASNDPAGGSFHQALHYLQVAKSGEFRYYDYGSSGNQIAYNQSEPPSYNLTASTAPVALFYGLNDYFVQPTDLLNMASQLPNKILRLVSYLKMNHVDFMFMTDIVKYVNAPVLTLSNEYNGLD